MVRGRVRRVALVVLLGLCLIGPVRPRARAQGTQVPIYISFLWHMHQPIYYPYFSATQTENNGAFSFSIADVHNQRAGPYCGWPVDAVEAAMNGGLEHAGAQVNFSGALIENLNDYENNNWGFQGWKSRWRQTNGWTTSLGHPRLDIVGFGYHHPLLPLTDAEVGQRQVELHKGISSAAWNRPYSRGFFPPENAFAEWMIPELVAEGMSWVFVDNIHLERASQGYPWNPGGNIIPPNASDQSNPDPKDWTSLQNLWAPTQVSAAWSHRPHYVKHIDPQTGQESRIIVVPTERYMGNEDARGGFGALLYDQVMSQIAWANTDPDHPALVVLHHDGDNYGGGTDSYYHSNFNNFISWAQQNGQRFVPTTIEDYLQLFPPDRNDVVHTEPGSWSGAANGDPQFKKWLAAPDASGYSSSIESWASILAATNRTKTAGSIDPTGPDQAEAWHYLLCGFASDYWYWPGQQVWDSNSTRAANQAATAADRVIAKGGNDVIGPQVFLPQRKPYNPGAMEWGPGPESSTFKVWTLAYDVSGLAAVNLRARTSAGPTPRAANETYAGGDGLARWHTMAMQVNALPPATTDPRPSYRAERYETVLSGLADHLVDYYVESTDTKGNVSRSPILHVYVGDQGAEAGFTPDAPTLDRTITIWAKKPGALHWGVNGWQMPAAVDRPQGTNVVAGAVETPLQGPDASGRYSVVLGPFQEVPAVSQLSFVFHYSDGSWGKATNGDYVVLIDPAPVRVTPPSPHWNERTTVRSPVPGVLRWGVNGWKLPPATSRAAGTIEVAGVCETPLAPDGTGGYATTVGPFETSLDVQSVNFVIHTSAGSWDNNDGLDYNVFVAPKSVWWSSDKLPGAAPLVVFAKAPGKLHAGTDGWQGVSDTPFVGPDANGTYSATIGPIAASAHVLDFAIHHDDGHWDNNAGSDYHVSR